MLRKRLLDPKFFKDKRVLMLRPIDRMLFIGLWCIADREALLKDEPFEIWLEVGSYDYKDEREVDVALQRLHDAGLIVRFDDKTHKYIYINNFKKYQHPHPGEAKSTYLNLIKFNEVTLNLVGLHEITVEKEKEEEEEEEDEDEDEEDIVGGEPESGSSPATTTEDTEPIDEVVFLFPTKSKDETWECKQSFITDYEKVYPDMDVRGEAQRALQYVKDNPCKRKTPTGMKRYLGSWFARGNDNGRYLRRKPEVKDDPDSNPWRVSTKNMQ